MPQYVNYERGGHTDKPLTGAACALLVPCGNDLFRYKLETRRRCREAEGRKLEADGRRFKMYQDRHDREKGWLPGCVRAAGFRPSALSSRIESVQSPNNLRSVHRTASHDIRRST